MSDLRQIPVSTIDGRPTTLGEHTGKVLLVVNVASKCGLTPQYEALEQLYEDKRDRGFEVLAFPSNDFGAQEPGTADEIVDFCSTTYNVQFPMYAKVSVLGADQHPLFTALTRSIPRAEGDPEAFRQRLRSHGRTPTDEPDIVWNFEKFLIAKDGTLARRFAPTMTPDDPTIIAAIDEQLGR